jgi:hypothetical protein
VLPRSEEIKDLALKFSKQQLSGLAQRGEIDPMTAVMAGMMRDRIVSEEMRQNMPETTVADDVLGAAQQMGQPQGVGQSQDQFAQMRQPVEGQPQMAMMAEGGLASIPFDDGMFDYAGGGIVAFSNGASVSLPIATRLQLREQMTPQEQAVFDRTGAIPERLQVPEQARDLRAPVRMESGRPIPIDVSTGQELGKEPPVIQDVNQAAMPSAGLSNIPFDRIMQRAETFASGLGPTSYSSVPSIQQASQNTKELLESAGYKENVFEDIRKDIQSQREGSAGDRKEAMNMRLIEAGLGIMAGESPYAFVNIGKGASGALRGLAEDLKDIKKSDRDLRLAEQNLMLKQNEAAMGRAGITQKTIQQAQERFDRAAENNARIRGDIAKTMLSGEIQERIARSAYGSRMTDFDKQWAQYTKDAKARKEEPTLDGFRRALEGSRAVVTDRQATQMAVDALKNTGLDLTTPDGKRQFEELKRYFKQQGSRETSLSPQDQQALNWANSNPNDPRAKQIKEYLGVQ